MPTITTRHEVAAPAPPLDRGRYREMCAEDDLHDKELMMQVRAGSAPAFEAIVGRYWPATVRYTLHLVRDADHASDVAQETFTRLWERRSDWEPRGSVLVWLLRTARHMVVSDARRQAVRTRWAAGAGREDAPCPTTPLHEMERTELRDAIHLAIRQLSPRRCEVFTLFHIQDLSYREIAEIMEIRPQTVANYLQAAVAELRESLGSFLDADPATHLPEG